MQLRWNQGRATIDSLLAKQQLERVTPSRDLADMMITQARNHLSSARTVKESDTAGAFQMAYDAARKSLAAILANQGLRAKGAGGHANLYDAVRAQLDPPMGSKLRPFDWMRQTRNDTEYPSVERPVATAPDVDEAIAAAEVMIDVASKVLDSMPTY